MLPWAVRAAALPTTRKLVADYVLGLHRGVSPSMLRSGRWSNVLRLLVHLLRRSGCPRKDWVQGGHQNLESRQDKEARHGGESAAGDCESEAVFPPPHHSTVS